MDARITRTRETALRTALRLLLSEGLAAVTPTRVAEESGLGRRTIYRHWPTAEALVVDALGDASYPTYAPTGDLATDVRAHLTQLRDALERGPLAHILHALGERAAVDADAARVRRRLTSKGCEPLRVVLRRAGLDGDALEGVVARIEGPLMHRALVTGDPITDDLIEAGVHLAVESATPRPTSAQAR